MSNKVNNSQDKGRAFSIFAIHNVVLASIPSIFYAILLYIPTAYSLLDIESEKSFVFLDGIMAFIYTFILFLFSTLHIRALYFCVSLFYALGSTYIYFVVNFKGPLNIASMKFLSYNDRVESVLNVFSMQGALLSMIFALLGIIIVQRSVAVSNKLYELYPGMFEGRRIERAIKAMVIFLCISAFFYPTQGRFGHMSSQYTPYSIFKYFMLDAKHRLGNKVIQKNDMTSRYKLDYAEHNPVDVVVILGDSMQVNCLSANGYGKRRNMPFIGAAKNVVSFSKSMKSKDFFMPDMFLRNRSNGYSIKETSVVSVFRKMGFRTSVISSYPRGSEEQSMMNVIFSEAEHILYRAHAAASLNKDSKDLMDQHLIDIMSAQIHDNLDKSHFFILHTQGNRWPYHRLYPRDFAYFHPECTSSTPSNCSSFELRNSYHNSIRYTDYVLKRVLDLLEKRDAIVFYVSSEGSELEGLSKRYAESNYNMDGGNPAMFVWASSKFINKRKDNFSYLAQHKDKIVSMENIYHTLLGCVGVESQIIDQGLSMCHQDSLRRCNRGV